MSMQPGPTEYAAAPECSRLWCTLAAARTQLSIGGKKSKEESAGS